MNFPHCLDGVQVSWTPIRLRSAVSKFAGCSHCIYWHVEWHSQVCWPFSDWRPLCPAAILAPGITHSHSYLGMSSLPAVWMPLLLNLSSSDAALLTASALHSRALQGRMWTEFRRFLCVKVQITVHQQNSTLGWPGKIAVLTAAQDFRRIAMHLDARTTGDCVVHYYRIQKLDEFAAVRRKQQLKKRRQQSEVNRSITYLGIGGAAAAAKRGDPYAQQNPGALRRFFVPTCFAICHLYPRLQPFDV